MALIADRHPEYLSTKLARERARAEGLPLIEVQHHHAHVAACLAENGYPLDAAPVLGIVLDGLGYGDDGTIWGGEFLLADYRGYERLGTFKPVAMPGGGAAVKEPWRNLYAHLMAEMGPAHLAMNFAELPLFAYLEAKPRATLDAMIKNGVNAPLASSCGRLFDAVAAALGLCRERQATRARPVPSSRPSSTTTCSATRTRPSPIRSPSRISAARGCPISSRWRCGMRSSAI